MIKTIEGNILNATEDIIVQQVNCMGVMGSGLAKQIRDKWPNVYTHYKYVCDQHKEDRRELLGQVAICIVKSGDRIQYVANIFGQYTYGRTGIHTNYEALRRGLIHLKRRAKKANKSIAIPWTIGCRLAGGDWNIVYEMIDNVFDDYEVTLYKFNG